MKITGFLFLVTLLCGYAARAAEFRVTCPKCDTAQRLTPTAIAVTGVVRTDGGFIEERTLKLRCDQRKCRHRFTAANKTFRREVVAVAIPPPLALLASRAKHP